MIIVLKNGEWGMLYWFFVEASYISMYHKYKVLINWSIYKSNYQKYSFCMISVISSLIELFTFSTFRDVIKFYTKWKYIYYKFCYNIFISISIVYDSLSSRENFWLKKWIAILECGQTLFAFLHIHLFSCIFNSHATQYPLYETKLSECL